jgi:hypothetical protein
MAILDLLCSKHRDSSVVPSSNQRKLKMLDQKQSFGIEISDKEIFQLMKSILSF